MPSMLLLIVEVEGACTNLGILQLLEVHSLPPLDIVQKIFGLWVPQAPQLLLQQ